MKKEIKSEILAAATRLFGERGYNRVSMRDIANELGISVGNLTYHFKRKEDLVEAAVVDKHTDYKKQQPVDTLAGLDAYFRRLFARHREKAYYFRHYTQLAQISQRVYDIQRGVLQDMDDMLQETFRALVLRGDLTPERQAGGYAHLAQAVITICIHGVPPIGGLDPMDEGERLCCIWALLLPLLTEQGKKQYDDMESANEQTV